MVSVPDKNFQENPSNGIRDFGENIHWSSCKVPLLTNWSQLTTCVKGTLLVCQIRIIRKIHSMISTALVKTCLIVCFVFDQKLPLIMTSLLEIFSSMLWKQWARLLQLGSINEILCMQIMTFWNVMPCSLVDTCQSLMGTSCLHLWHRKISCVRKRNPHTGNWWQELELLASQCETVAVRYEKKWKEFQSRQRKSESLDSTRFQKW